jgi:hypothetical protein
LKTIYDPLKNNINSGISMNSGQLSQVPRKERGLLDISRQQAIKNNIYFPFAEKRGDRFIFRGHNSRSAGTGKRKSMGPDKTCR